MEGGKGVETIVDHFFYASSPVSKASSSFNDVKRVSDDTFSKPVDTGSPVKLDNPFKTLSELESNIHEDPKLGSDGHKDSSPMVEVESDDIDDDEFHDLEFQVNEEEDLKPTPIGSRDLFPAQDGDQHKSSSAHSILQNIHNLVSMLGGSSVEERKHLNELEEMDKQMKSQTTQLKQDINQLIFARSEKSEL